MKKIFISLLAIAALASCAKTEDVFTEGESEIMLSPVAALQTKANHLGAIDGIKYPTEENFDVYAYWKNVPAGQEFTDGSLFLQSLTEGGAEFTNKGAYWGGVDKYYWPKNGSLRFAAYSPAHLTVAHEQVNDVYSISYEQPSETAKTWDFLVAPTSPSYSMMTATEKVAIEFQHALSWLTLKVVAKDADAAMAFDIKKVTILDVNTKADFAASMTDGIQYKEWSNQNTTADYVVFEGSQAPTVTPTDIETTAAGTIVIPQNTTTVRIEFDQYGLNGTADTPGMVVDLDLVLDTDNTPWEPGKHYIYNLIFGLDEILINPSVADWTDVEVGELVVDAANVSTLDQLKAALENGGKIVLQNDIDAGETSFKVAKDTRLELNGHKITGTDNLTGSYALFEVQPDKSFTVNGPGTLTASAKNNRGWNAFSSVLSNQRGTLTVNEGVVVEHLGGTDMAYGIDNLTNTGAQPAVTVVNGATVKSTYRAIRQFLNSVTGSNELYVYAGSKIEGTNKSIWSQNANTKANIGKLVVEEGAELKGDVMLSASNAPVWAAEAYVPASTLVDPSTVVPSNVAAGYAVALVDGVYTIVKGATGVATAEEFAAAVKSDAKEVSLMLTADIEVPITSLGQQTGGSGEYKLAGEATEKITIDLNGHNLTITTTYWSAIGAKNDNALFTIKNGTMNSTGNSAGTWNAYDLRFSNCNYVVENVKFAKPVAFDNVGKSATLKDVEITEATDKYAMWITAEGQNVTIDGLTINAGRGIKIDEQYVDAPAKVTLKVTDATFTTAAKAAILVKSVAGANIILDNVNIDAVEADDFFPVWVDEDAAAYADQVKVSGGLCKVEGAPISGVDTDTELREALKAGHDVILDADINTTDAESNGYGATGININGGVFDGNGHTIEVEGATSTWDSAIAIKGGTIKNVTVAKGFRGIFFKNGTEKIVLENVIINGPVYTISCDQAGKQGFEAYNSKFYGWTSYAGTIGTGYFEGCTFGAGAGYNFSRPYAPTTYVNCAFEAGHQIDARAKVSFENCTLDGVALTSDNINTLVTGNRQNIESVK